MSPRRRPTSAGKRVRRAKGSREEASTQRRPARARSTSLESVARAITGRAGPSRPATSLESIARAIREDAKPSPAERADPRSSEGPLDVLLPARPIRVELVAGRAHYDRVIAAVLAAHTSVWIATANAKGLLVEGPRRARARDRYVSILSLFDGLAKRGVELRLLHAEMPSRPFRAELQEHPRLVAGGLALARCPRVHLKAVIVDGALLYLGSANWTGAGLGAKGTGKRNFELGIVTDDAPLLDQVQAMFERIWSGGECAGCKLRDVCPGPLDEHP